MSAPTTKSKVGKEIVMEKSWCEEPIAGIIFRAGNSSEYKTGSWRTYRPVWNAEKCIQCLRCYLLCPDMAIRISDGKVCGIDYEYCKGCGICANECPKKAQAIEMVLETEVAEKEKKERV